MRALAASLLLSLCGCSEDEPTRHEGRLPLEPLRQEAGVQLVTYAGAAPLDASAVRPQLMFRNDVQRSGFFAENVALPDDFVLAWELTGLNPREHSAAKGSAVVVGAAPDVRILVGGDSGWLHCLTAAGEPVWSAQTGPSHEGIHGTPAVHDGVVYVGAYDGALYAFALATGELVFRSHLGGSIGSSPVVHQGKIYVSVETPQPSGILGVLDARTGELLWHDDNLRDQPHSSVALDPGRNVMAVGDNSGDLTAWDLAPPRRRFVFPTGNAIKGPILLHDGVAFFGTWDHHVYAVDLQSGHQRWRFQARAPVMSGAAVAPDLGLVYIGSHDHSLYALHAATGELAWEYRAQGAIISCPVVAGARILVGSNDGRLQIIERDSGRPIYSFRARGDVSSTAAILGDRMVFADRSSDEGPGSLYALAPPLF